MRAPLGSRGALLGDLGISLGAALNGGQRRARIDMRGRGRWPSAGATLDLDFVNQQGYAYGQGIGRIRDLVTISGGAGGTVVGPSGLIVSASAPRFDYDPLTLACKGLLIEGQRTNLLPRSSEFDHIAWSKTNATVSANAVLGPDGTVAADKLISSAVSGEHYVASASVGVASGATLAGLCIAKAGEKRYLRILIGGGAPGWNAYVAFDLVAGSKGAALTNSGVVVDSFIRPMVDGFYLCGLVATGAAGSTSANLQIGIANSTNANDATHTGDDASGLYIWGADLQAGFYATSHIPTGAAAVTRTADNAVISGANFASWFNASEGTIYVEVSQPHTNLQYCQAASIDDGTLANRISLGKGSTGNYALSINVSVDSVHQYNNGNVGTASAFPVKQSLAYKANDFAACLNATTVATGTSGAIPSVNRLGIGSRNAPASDFLNGHIRRLRYWPRRLSNGELQELTR